MTNVSNDKLTKTYGFMYLDVDDPICAWNAYRGVIFSPDQVEIPGFISSWAVASIRRGPRSSRVQRECKLEKIRREFYTEKVPRTKSLYVFLDDESAISAKKHMGLPYMKDSNLAKIVFFDGAKKTVHDSNWITYHSDDISDSWAHSYWKGEPCPDYKPVWECLLQGRIAVDAPIVRQKCYVTLKREFPESLPLIEISRISAHLYFDTGTIYPYIHKNGEVLKVSYVINLNGLREEWFLSPFGKYLSSGNPVNFADLHKDYGKDILFRVPDFQKLSVDIDLNKASYLEDIL